ncbi:hypothetical protein OIU76_011838 [Salix suchowensis]|nr:hypothetical protein OIU76_011838 [Salix suchowensis]
MPDSPWSLSSLLILPRLQFLASIREEKGIVRDLALQLVRKRFEIFRVKYSIL